MEKMLLIDGNSLVNRAYYALPPLNNPQGMQVQAVFGFATMLVKMIETVKPDYIVTAFDVHAPTFRHKLYDGYKSRRKGMPDELAAQMPVLKEMLDVMGVRRVEMAGYEADGIIRTLSKRYDVQTYIVTGDRDSLQLVDSSTRVLLTKRGITEVDEIDETSLLEKYELTPQGIIDYKALAGDGSDDIPGVPGIGDKIAKNLLKQYGSLSGVYASLDDIGTRIRNILLKGKASAELSKTLATIDVAVPFECELEECKYEFPFSSSVFAFFESQGFKSLIRRAEIFTTGTVPTASSRKVAERVQIASAEKLREIIQGKTEVAMHVTESEFHFAVDEGTEYVVNLSYSFFDAGLSEPEIIAAVKDVLCDGRITKVVFDSKSFITYIYKNYKILCDGFFDVGLAQYIADATVPHAVMNGLFEAYSIAAADLASGMLTLKRELNEALNESGMRRLYYDIELPLVKVLFDMEQAGFEVNRARLEEIGAVYSEEEQRLTK